MEKLFFPFEIKAETVDIDGRFSGYGAVFGNVDSYGDIIEKGAFAEGIAKKGIENIPMLWQHDSRKPIGRYERLEEDSYGLGVDGQILKDLTVLPAKDAIILIKNRVLKGLSVGYETVKKKYNKAGNRVLQKINLWEISPVTFAANDLAQITGIKNIDNKRDMENYLREAGFSRGDAKYMSSRHIFQREAEDDALTTVLNDLKLLNTRIGV
jgi:HK97 family phage prohead protease